MYTDFYVIKLKSYNIEIVMKKIYRRFLELRKQNKESSYRLEMKYLDDFMKHIEKIVFFNEKSDYYNTELYKLLIKKIENNNKNKNNKNKKLDYSINVIISIYDTEIINSDKKIKIYESVIFTKDKFIKWINDFIGYNYYRIPIKMKIEETEWEFIERKEDKDKIHFINNKLNNFVKENNKDIIAQMIINFYTFINAITKNLKNIHSSETVPYDKDILTLQMCDFDIITDEEGELFFNLKKGIFIYDEVNSETEHENIKQSFYHNKTKTKKKERRETILEFIKSLSLDYKNNKNDEYKSLIDNEEKRTIYDTDEDSYYSSSEDSDTSISSDENIIELYNKKNICIKKRDKYYLY